MKSKAFTLLEILVAVAVMGIFGLLVINAAAAFKKRQFVVGTQNNMRQIYMSMSLYATDHGGHLPKVSVLGSEGDPADYVFMMKNEAVADFGRGGLIDYLGDAEKIFLAPGDIGLKPDGSPGRNFTFSFNFLINKGELLPGASEPSGFHKALGTARLFNIANPTRKVLLFEQERPDDPFCVWFIEHFTTRHGGKANFVFADGHAELLPPEDVFGNAELCELVSQDSQY